eukprot:scaffold215635_cov18-Tisochrysis_lutea.AAC.1
MKSAQNPAAHTAPLHKNALQKTILYLKNARGPAAHNASTFDKPHKKSSTLIKKSCICTPHLHAA